MLQSYRTWACCILAIINFCCTESKEKYTNTSQTIKAPIGMVFVRSGETQIGSIDGLPQERPVFKTKVSAFFMDISPVTVAEFRKFIEATNYKTEAEKFGDAGVFDDNTKAWLLKKGANWEYPLGKTEPKSPEDHPVTQVSWNDASAYAKWAGKRLPTEIEWEHAARNARNDQTLYPFGNEIVENGNYKANVWQGIFPENNKVSDGFATTSPVGQFGKTPLGLTDMTGNVWEWCENWKMSYEDMAVGKVPTAPTEKAQRGGSFLCEPSWCHGYRVSGRSFSTPETSLMHLGFRCVKSVPPSNPKSQI